MSYAKWGADSDVYVFAGDGGFWCAGCSLMGLEDTDFFCRDPQSMIDHLKRHQDLDDLVPQSAIERLKRESAGK